MDNKIKAQFVLCIISRSVTRSQFVHMTTLKTRSGNSNSHTIINTDKIIFMNKSEDDITISCRCVLFIFY